MTIDVLLGFFREISEVFANLARDGVKVLTLAKVEETGWKDGDVVKGHCCVDRNIGSNLEAEHSLESRRMGHTMRCPRSIVGERIVGARRARRTSGMINSGNLAVVDVVKQQSLKCRRGSRKEVGRHADTIEGLTSCST